jgi:hypothetical protein
MKTYKSINCISIIVLAVGITTSTFRQFATNGFNLMTTYTLFIFPKILTLDSGTDKKEKLRRHESFFLKLGTVITVFFDRHPKKF